MKAVQKDISIKTQISGCVVVLLLQFSHGWLRIGFELRENPESEKHMLPAVSELSQQHPSPSSPDAGNSRAQLKICKDLTGT